MGNFNITILGCGSATPTVRHMPSAQAVAYGGRSFFSAVPYVACGRPYYNRGLPEMAERSRSHAGFASVVGPIGFRGLYHCHTVTRVSYSFYKYYIFCVF